MVTKSSKKLSSRRSSRWNTRDQEASLLANPSPPPSPSPYGSYSTSTVNEPTAPATKHATHSNSSSPPSSSTPPRRSSLSLDTAATSTNSQLPPENRFLPQHVPKEDTRQVQSASMALQFVPAYEESTSPSRAQRPQHQTMSLTNHATLMPLMTHPNGSSSNDTQSASWDDIIQANDATSGDRGRASSSNNNQQELARSGSSEGKGQLRRRSRSSQELRGTLEVQTSSAITSPTNTIRTTNASFAAEASPSTTASTRRGPRMARLAKIFSSRTAVHGPRSPPQQQQLSSSSGVPASATTELNSVAPAKVSTTQQAPRTRTARLKSKAAVLSSKAAIVPQSPSRSSVSGSSASGYVGWPGTQDKRGGTVAIQSSYDDSSVGNAAAFHQRRKLANLDDSDLEMSKWMDSSFDEESLTSVPQDKPSQQQRLTPTEVYASAEHDDGEPEEENPADFHLKALVATSTAATPLAKGVPPSGARSANGQTPKDTLHRPGGRPGYNDRAGNTRSIPTSSRAGTSSVTETTASGAISIKNLFGSDATGRASSAVAKPVYLADPWDIDSSPHPSSPGTSISKNSSAYFDMRDANGMALPSLDGKRQPYPYGMKPNMRAGASAVIRRKSREQPRPERPRIPQPPTEAALASNSRQSPTNSPSHGAEHLRGYRGFYDKTKEMPNLIDALDSDSVASSRATSTFSANAAPPSRRRIDQPDRIDEDSDILDGAISDVFDGLSNAHVESSAAPNRMRSSDSHPATMSEQRRPYEKLNDTSSESATNLKLVMLGGGLTAIQTTPDAYEKRQTAREFDEDLTNSDVGQYGFTRLPGFNNIASAGRREQAHNRIVPPNTEVRDHRSPYDRLPPNVQAHLAASRHGAGPQKSSMFDSNFTGGASESGSSYGSDLIHGDLAEYRIHPKQTRKLVRRYRELCPTDLDYLTPDEYQREEDSKKAFALQEMRSRIMEKDIERGLERQGGTIVVDDIVTTAYHQAAQRVRDAVIVSKAWRDGASPRDVITAALLTRREERTYYVKRPIAYRSSPVRSPGSGGSSSASSTQWRSYTLEAVRWLDDVDFMQLRCPSLGPRYMRGFETFTIGDCQSILLKLTNEHCQSLRGELNEATARQIEAEESMREDGDAEEGMMTEAEMTFLTSMEEVKMISKKLVVAEKSFNLVRDRIEKLVSRYEALLVKIESENTYAPSSIATYESSYYSDGGSHSSEEDREKEQLARRAQRAELRAELAAREAMMAKQEAEKIRKEKQYELEMLQQKLNELQSESSLAIAEREHSAVLARAITSHEGDARSVNDPVKPKIDQEKVESVKRKFRDRVAARMRSASPASSRSSFTSSRVYSPVVASHRNTSVVPPISGRPPPARRNKYGLTGEEMFQHLDFYERSLKAVEDARHTLMKYDDDDGI